MRAANPVTAITTEVVCQSGERMLARGLANLLKPLIVSDAATHAIEILRDNRVIVVRQRKPIQIHGSSVAGFRSDRQADLSPHSIVKLLQTVQLANDYIRSWLRAYRREHH
jgi:hypothetical protein